MIREDGAHGSDLRIRRLLDLGHNFSSVDHVLRAVDDQRAGLLVGLVREAAAQTCSHLNENAVTHPRECTHPGRHYGDSQLPILGLPQDTHPHDFAASALSRGFTHRLGGGVAAT